MQIVHVIRTLDPAAGGPPMAATRLAAAQAGLGHEVRIVTQALPGEEERVQAMFRGMPHGDQLHRDSLPKGGLEKFLARQARRHLGGLMDRTDFVHIHGLWSAITIAASDAAQRHRVPYAVVPHGMLNPWSMTQSRLKKTIAMKLSVRGLLNRAAFLHALNADEKTMMGPHGLHAPVEVIPNGVFLEELEPLPAAGTFRAQHPILDDRPFIFFLGRLHHVKGLDYLAEGFELVARKLPDVHLVIAGPDGGAQEDLERQIAEAKLQERVHVIGPIYGPDKLAALVDAACFCQPSRQEGFSISITEALACGLPAVVTETCHYPEVAEVDAGEVVPLDAEAVGAALVRVLSDETRRSEMGKRARELVASRFTWPTIAARAIELYEWYRGDRG